MPTKAEMEFEINRLKERNFDLEETLYEYSLKCTKLVTYYEQICDENGLSHKIKDLSMVQDPNV